MQGERNCHRGRAAKQPFTSPANGPADRKPLAIVREDAWGSQTGRAVKQPLSSPAGEAKTRTENSFEYKLWMKALTRRGEVSEELNTRSTARITLKRSSSLSWSSTQGTPALSANSQQQDRFCQSLPAARPSAKALDTKPKAPDPAPGPLLDMLKMRCETSGSSYSMFWERITCGGRPVLTVLAGYVTPARKASLVRMGMSDSFPDSCRDVVLDEAGDSVVAKALRSKESIFIENVATCPSFVRQDKAARFGIQSITFLATAGGVIEYGTVHHTHSQKYSASEFL
jgi:hypothetical protein